VALGRNAGVGCLMPGKVCAPARELRTKLNTPGANGVPIQVRINACYSFSLIDPNNYRAFPAKSTVVTSANSNRTSFGGPAFSDPDGRAFAASLYSHAFSACLRDGGADQNKDDVVDDCEGHDWVLAQKPPANCYPWKAGVKIACSIRRIRPNLSKSSIPSRRKLW